ncbi:MAG: sulfurtransferase complex subunit TusB [Gammaproteobacteria bacterium]|nr:MAG: sulfurtransferase complex subunit TusB [Gammaproteobacteria bacterium]
MSALHTVNKSPFERNSLASCLRLAAKGSAVLLFEDGVIGAMKNTKHSDAVANSMSDISFYVLGPDIKARGLKDGNVIDGIKIIDYDGFVDLTTEHHTVQSWL